MPWNTISIADITAELLLSEVTALETIQGGNDEKKKEKENRRKERESRSDLKDIQISPVIQDGDLEVKIKK